ncbi:hypothetical protein ABG067_000864 [Albugo candida]
MDPLAVLEREYQTVITQSSLRHDQIAEEVGEKFIGNTQDERKDQEDSYGYSILCSSPRENEPSDLDEEPIELNQPVAISQGNSDKTACFTRKITLEASKKEAIQKCMQNIRLNPSAKYQKSNLTDSQLVDLVHEQLGLGRIQDISLLPLAEME